jgi:hypothetical protein
LNDLLGNECQQSLQKSLDLLTSEDTPDQGIINDAVSCFNDAIYQAADPYFANYRYTNRTITFVDNKLPWFSDDCESKRRVFFYQQNLFRLDNSDVNRVGMVTARKEFRKAARLARLQYDRRQTDDLLRARCQNAKAYWKLLKGCTKAPTCNITADNFARYVEVVNNPQDVFFIPDDDVVDFFRNM